MAATELVDPEDYAKRTAREIVARWMLTNGFATGHGDSLYDLLRELEGQVNELKSRLQAEAPTREQVAAEIYSAFPFPDNMRGPNSDACLSWEKAPAHAREVTYRRADAILALPGLRTSQAEAQAPAVTREQIAEALYNNVFGGTSDPDLDENLRSICLGQADSILAILPIAPTLTADEARDLRVARTLQQTADRNVVVDQVARLIAIVDRLAPRNV